MQRPRSGRVCVYLVTNVLLALSIWLSRASAFRLSRWSASALCPAQSPSCVGTAHRLSTPLIAAGCELGSFPSGCTNEFFWRRHGSQTALGISSRRHLQVIRRKKYRTKGTSTVRRHYGIKGRGGGKLRLGKHTGVPLQAMECPARRCMLLGKMDNTKARNRSHSRVATHKVQRLNLHWKRLWWPEAGYYVRLRLSVKGIRTIKKYGLQRAADKFGLNLKKKKYYAGYSHRRMVSRLSLAGGTAGHINADEIAGPLSGQRETSTIARVDAAKM
ncbi:ribosomal protein RPL28 [Toxoplasma gondii GT1]|nr:large ribosomal protein L28 precursor [Toxoplasma gondii]AAC63958.1 large ribosomal protein L28 precursor [Toxoplasma gondii]EPR57871.1 ribosomal protein RPL28 [Toxoplasma gondii GT1]CAJ20658.1 large ribosomal protein l28 precursor, putative [Toxoplasma gondii RH]